MGLEHIEIEGKKYCWRLQTRHCMYRKLLTRSTELILFYCAFIAFKARHPLTVGIDPMEFKLKGEDRLFQA